jgi:hypothetical protein
MYAGLAAHIPKDKPGTYELTGPAIGVLTIEGKSYTAASKSLVPYVEQLELPCIPEQINVEQEEALPLIVEKPKRTKKPKAMDPVKEVPAQDEPVKETLPVKAWDDLCYHAHPAISFSKLSLLDQNVIKYYRRYVLCEDEPKSDAFRYGGAFDLYFTEPERFASEITVKDVAVTKVENCITTGELAAFKAMANSVKCFNQWSASHVFGTYTLEEVFEISEAQHTMFWDCPVTGKAMRGKTDYITKLSDRIIITDLKTTKAESMEECIKSFFNFRYYLQAAAYITGAETLYNLPVEMYFVFVSKNTFETFVIRVTDEVLNYGKQEMYRLIAKLHRLEENNSWLIPQQSQDIFLPRYMQIAA